MACLGVLAYAPLVVVALLALGVAGIGQAYFGSAQAILPVEVVAPHERAAALGLVSTTIGVALPTGMIILGVTSSLLGPQLAMVVSAVVGLIAVAATAFVSRDLMRPPDPGTPSGAGPISRGREGHPIAAQPELG
jgi:predicted MFS family arabinose efflux permease